MFKLSFESLKSTCIFYFSNQPYLSVPTKIVERKGLPFAIVNSVLEEVRKHFGKKKDSGSVLFPIKIMS